MKHWLYHLEKQIHLNGGSLQLPFQSQVSGLGQVDLATNRMSLGGCMWGGLNTVQGNSDFASAVMKEHRAGAGIEGLLTLYL